VKILDLKWKRFWRLLVLDQQWLTKNWNKLWKCLCDCWNEKLISSSHLINKQTVSCWCKRSSPIIDIKWKKINKLTAIKLDRKEKDTYYRECRCDCWNTKVVSSSKLTRWIIKSCWCLWKENIRKPEWLAPAYQIYRGYKRNANDKWRNFEISFDDFLEITQKECIYCWRHQISSTNIKTSRAVYKYNWIDRVDNSRWYEKDNIVPCCKRCNKAKSTLSKNEFLELIEMIYKNTLWSRQRYVK